MIKRVTILILDACGVGELHDAKQYGDIGAATIPNVAEKLGGLHMPNCAELGLGNIVPIRGVGPVKKARGAYGKMAEVSPGKDSTTGHWEIAGVHLKCPFPVYPEGFPEELVEEFENRAGIKTIGNVPASGTEIIEQLGKQHLESGHVILYTSADSVFQLAAHEEVIPLERLYEICRIARGLLTGGNGVGRVIARPFLGQPGHFKRTAHRKDFSLEPTDITILDKLRENNFPVIAIGKINDLFAGKGIDRAVKTADNIDVIENVIAELEKNGHGLIFANLVDFDMLWGHRNDYESFGRGLEIFDLRLPDIMKCMNKNDLLIITADHGCDPTLADSTDHTREYVPLLVYGPDLPGDRSLGIRETFADISSTLADMLGIEYTFPGNSFWTNLQTKRETDD